MSDPCNIVEYSLLYSIDVKNPQVCKEVVSTLKKFGIKIDFHTSDYMYRLINNIGIVKGVYENNNSRYTKLLALGHLTNHTSYTVFKKKHIKGMDLINSDDFIKTLVECGYPIDHISIDNKKLNRKLFKLNLNELKKLAN